RLKRDLTAAVKAHSHLGRVFARSVRRQTVHERKAKLRRLSRSVRKIPASQIDDKINIPVSGVGIEARILTAGIALHPEYAVASRSRIGQRLRPEHERSRFIADVVETLSSRIVETPVVKDLSTERTDSPQNGRSENSRTQQRLERKNGRMPALFPVHGELVFC